MRRFRVPALEPKLVERGHYPRRVGVLCRIDTVSTLMRRGLPTASRPREPGTRPGAELRAFIFWRRGHVVAHRAYGSVPREWSDVVGAAAHRPR